MSDIYTASYIATEIRPVILRLQADLCGVSEVLARLEIGLAGVNQRLDRMDERLERLEHLMGKM
jgi:hypothetical protein